MGLLLLWIFSAVVFSHFCSLLETTLFSVRISALMERRAAGSKGAKLLLQIKQNRIDDAISAILILNTFAITVGSTLAGAQAAKLFGDKWVGFLSIVLTVLLLVLSEIIPKSMAARYAGSFSGFVGYALSYLMYLMAPILVLTKALIRLIARRPSERLTRREFSLLVDTAPREGAISLAESMLIGSLIYSREVTLKEVMTPSSVIFMMDAEQTVGDLLMQSGADAFSRIPLFQANRQHVIGYVNHRDVLKAFALNNEKTSKLVVFLQPIPKFSETISVVNALEKILQQREAIALVTDKHNELIGLITLEDLLEVILGMQITDEADAIESLRPDVTQLRRHRAERLRHKRVRRQSNLD